MEPLFETKTAYSLEEYKKFNKAILSKQLKLPLLSAIIIALFLFISLYFLFYKEYIPFIVYAFVILISVPVFIKVYNKNIEKSYYSNKTLMKTVSEFKFFENELTEQTQKGIAAFKYEDFHKIIETKTNYYLMIAQNQGYIIIKKNCSPELIQFLSNLKAERKL